MSVTTRSSFSAVSLMLFSLASGGWPSGKGIVNCSLHVVDRVARDLDAFAVDL